MASSSVKTDVTAPALVEFLKEIDGLRGAMPVKPEELNDAKDYLIRGFPAEFETISQIAGRLETLVEYKLPDDYFNTMIPESHRRDGRRRARRGQEIHPPEQPLDHHRGRSGKDRKSLQALPAGKNIEYMKFDEDFRLVPAK